MCPAEDFPKNAESLNILVVEDEPVNQKLAIAIIEDGGHTASLTDNGEKAVALVASNRFDLVLMDVVMPEMDGLEATRRIRQQEKGTGKYTPIVALTTTEDREPCIAVGMDEYIDKPINAIQLTRTIERVGLDRDSLRVAETEDLRILMIEDSKTAAKMAEICLEQGLLIPFSVTTAESLAAGLEQLDGHEIDLLLLDLNLADSQGLATFHSVRAKASELPIVILSGEDDESMAIAAVRRGAQDYLVKGRFDDKSLCRAIHFAIERSRRRAEQELRSTKAQLYVAQLVQQELFPKSSPEIDGLDIFGKCEPAEATGGDYYDYIPMGDSLGIVVADACGHGVGAAFTMVASRAILRALATVYRDPGHLISYVNELLSEDLRAGDFITVLFANFDPEQRTIKYVAAGHRGYLLDANGDIKHVLEPTSMPLNIHEEGNYETSAPIQIEPGDILLMTTDGVTERLDPDINQFGDDRLLEEVKKHRELPARGIVEMIFHALHEFGRGREIHDDTSAVVAKFC